MTAQLETQVVELKRSSDFRSGDRNSFMVKLGEETLPGNHDPAAYLDQLGLTEVSGKIAVVCPGNCGLMMELRRRGADRVIGFEPRSRFHRSLTKILNIANQLDGSPVWPFSSQFWWPSSNVIRETHEVVIWANDTEFCRQPETQIEGALSLLKPGGSLFVEVVLGTQGVPEKGTPINAWRPSEESFKELVNQVRAGVTVTRVCDGRMDQRAVYQITEEVVVMEDSTVQSEVLDETQLREEALSQFPENIRDRIGSLLDDGFDYHVVKEAFENNGEQGIETLEGADPQA